MTGVPNLTDPGAIVVPKEPDDSGAKGLDLGRLVRKVLLEYAMLWVLAIVLIVAGIAYPGFYNEQNLYNVLGQNAPLGITAVGVTLLLIAGGFDFSVGGVFAVAAVVFALAADSVPLAVAALAAVGIATFCGILTATAVEVLEVNDFIATLGAGTAYGGAAFLLSGSAPVMPDNVSFGSIGTDVWLGIPVPGLILIGVIAIGWLVLEGTVYGRWLYIVGGNREAARLAGLRVGWIRASAFLIVGACAGLGGLIAASQLGVAEGSMGATLALDAFTVVVIGGTSMFGGEGRMWRTIVGLLIIATINNVFDALAVDSNWQAVAKGTILIGAVALDRLSYRFR